MWWGLSVSCNACNDFQDDCPFEAVECPRGDFAHWSGWNGALSGGPWAGEPCHAAIPAPAVRQALQAVRERIAAQERR